MTEFIFVIMLASAVGFISYHVGKQDQREETCIAAGGIVSKDKCYFRMEEKKLENLK